MRTHLSCHSLLPRIEFGSSVDVVSASSASDGHGYHHSYFVLIIFDSLNPRYLTRIKINRIILLNNFSLSHDRNVGETEAAYRSTAQNVNVSAVSFSESVSGGGHPLWSAQSRRSRVHSYQVAVIQSRCRLELDGEASVDRSRSEALYLAAIDPPWHSSLAIVDSINNVGTRV
jgi:hypothetical protein